MPNPAQSLQNSSPYLYDVIENLPPKVDKQPLYQFVYEKLHLFDSVRLEESATTHLSRIFGPLNPRGKLYKEYDPIELLINRIFIKSFEHNPQGVINSFKKHFPQDPLPICPSWKQTVYVHTPQLLANIAPSKFVIYGVSLSRLALLGLAICFTYTSLTHILSQLPAQILSLCTTVSKVIQVITTFLSYLFLGYFFLCQVLSIFPNTPYLSTIFSEQNLARVVLVFQIIVPNRREGLNIDEHLNWGKSTCHYVKNYFNKIAKTNQDWLNLPIQAKTKQVWRQLLTNCRPVAAA